MESVCKVLLVIAANCTFPPRQIGAATVCDLWPEVAAFKSEEKQYHKVIEVNKCNENPLLVLLDWDWPRRGKAQMIPFPFECVCASQSVYLDYSCVAVQLSVFS